MKQKEYREYKEWLGSEKGKKFVIDNVKKSGIPLELRARKILKDNGFRVSNARYLDTDSDNPDIDLTLGRGIWRELDILAVRLEQSGLNFQGSEIHFTSNILAECKYSSDRDVLVFGYSESENIDLSHFPIMVNGQSIIDIPSKAGISLPLLVERMVEVDPSSVSREKDNLRDIGLHKACEQILPAIRYNLNRWRHVLRRHYIDTSKASRIMEKWEELVKMQKLPYEQSGNQSRVPKDFINKFLQENFDPDQMLRDFPLIPIHLCFPLIITDESRGIIKAKLDDSYNIVDLEDKGFCLYTYTSENAERFESVLDNSFVIPIFICNLASLPSVIKLISQVTNNIVEQTRQLITANPSLVPREVIFNDKVNKLS